MVKYREILRLAAMGVSQSSIAFSCACAQSTVSDVLRAARAHQLSWPLPEEMDDAAIRAVIYQKESRKSWDKAVNGNVFYRRCGKESFPSAVSRISPGLVTSFSLDAVRTSSHSSVRRFSL